MRDASSTRRQFIAAFGVAGMVSVAGCSGVLDNSNPSTKNNTPSSTSTSTQGSSGGTPTNTSTRDNSNKNNKTSKAPFTRGKVVDDFEGDVGSRWQVDYGKYMVSKKDVYQGSQSLVLEPRKPSKRKQSVTRPFARISKYFSGSNKALDLSQDDLTMAVKVEKPTGMGIDITANFYAPTSSLSLTSSRYIPKEMHDWVRFDLGYTSTDGKPTLKNVIQLEIIVATNPKQIKDFRVKIDDLRTIPKPTKGTVIFQFDDGTLSSYEKAFPVLKEKGWPGACAVIPDAIGGENRMTLSMMTEMQKNGWDMMSHAGHERPLPLLPAKIQRRKIEKGYQQLKSLGFAKGARHFVAPYNRVSGTTLDIISDVHETGFLFGACPNNAQHPSNPYFISRVQGPAVRGAKDIIDMAAQFNQMAVLTYHILGGEGTPMNVFKEIVNYVEKQNVDVITPSQLIDGKN
jgi:peptidoglycan/xylan/chitin deacetylase (PgdA/CDA1 family)